MKIAALVFTLFALPAQAMCVATDIFTPDVITCGTPDDLLAHDWSDGCFNAGVCKEVDTTGLLRYAKSVCLDALDCLLYEEAALLRVLRLERHRSQE